LASHLLACTSPYVMPWAVALTHGEAQTGILGACTTLVGISNTFLMGLCNYLSPRAARAFADGGVPELRAVLWKTTGLFVATLGTMAVAALLLGEQVAVAVYGAEFHGSGPIVAVLAFSVLANSFGVTAGNGLWAMERPRASFLADVIALGVIVVASILLLPRWGALGGAVAILAGTTVDAVVRLFVLWRTMREHEHPGHNRLGAAL
jgi:O-antigen/teichoic acid export membrane protein